MPGRSVIETVRIFFKKIHVGHCYDLRLAIMKPVYRSVKQNASRNLSIKTLVNPSFSTVEGTLFNMQESQDNAADSVDLMRDIRSTGLSIFCFVLLRTR